MSCRSTCACQCQNSACGCLSPGKQPPARPKRPAITSYLSPTQPPVQPTSKTTREVTP